MLWLLAAILGAGLYWVLSPQRPSPQATAPPAAQPRATIVLAATTSVQDSGLLDRLLLDFQRETGIQVRTMAVGSGKALELGRLGEADVVLSHSPALEEKFVGDGFAAERLPFAHNEFVIAGPAADPAGIRRSTSAADAFARIARSGSPFISRGDGSGTYAREQAIWAKAGLKSGGKGYAKSELGMGATLRMADDRKAYTLVDRSTLMSYGGKIGLEILYEGCPDLANPYSVLVVSGGRDARRYEAEAARLADFLTGTAGQKIIAEFRGSAAEPLFKPAAAGPR